MEGMRITLTQGEPTRKMTYEEVLAHIYDESDRPAVLPVTPPKVIDFAVVKDPHAGVFVAACLNVDITSQGATPDEAEANLREAISLYYADQHEQLVARFGKIELVAQGTMKHV